MRELNVLEWPAKWALLGIYEDATEDARAMEQDLILQFHLDDNFKPLKTCSLRVRKPH